MSILSLSAVVVGLLRWSLCRSLVCSSSRTVADMAIALFRSTISLMGFSLVLSWLMRSL